MKKYIIDTDENRSFLKENAKELLCFGQRFPSSLGSSYYLLDDGTPDMNRSRETWITSRMAHVYSIGKMLGYEGCGELAEKAVNGLLTELKDNTYGGWYAGVNADESYLPTKQCYAHAFVILAGTSSLLADVKGSKELLSEALKVYDEKFWNEEEGLSVDTWNTEFTVCDSYRGLNANMHSVEAFLAAYDALGDDKYKVRAGRIIDRVIDWAKNNNYRIPEHFSRNWEPKLEMNKDKPDDQFKPYGATPGHGIEWARLITQYSSGNKKYISEAEKLFCTAINDAWNYENILGIAYTTDWNGKPVVKDRMHWTLAEAINTSAVLYRATCNSKYAGYYAEFMKYLDEKVMDHKLGSWYHQLDENNNLKTTVWPGKPDIYHAFQAMLIPYLPEYTSIAKSVS